MRTLIQKDYMHPNVEKKIIYSAEDMEVHQQKYRLKKCFIHTNTYDGILLSHKKMKFCHL